MLPSFFFFFFFFFSSFFFNFNHVSWCKSNSYSCSYSNLDGGRFFLYEINK